MMYKTPGQTMFEYLGDGGDWLDQPRAARRWWEWRAVERLKLPLTEEDRAAGRISVPMEVAV